MRHELGFLNSCGITKKSTLPPSKIFGGDVDVVPVFKIGGSCIKTQEDFTRVIQLLVDAHAQNPKIVFSAAFSVTDTCDKIHKKLTRENIEAKFLELHTLHKKFIKPSDVLYDRFNDFMLDLSNEVVEVASVSSEDENLYPYISSIGERIMEFLIVETLKSRGFPYEVIDPTKVIYLFKEDKENLHGFESRLNLGCTLGNLIRVLKPLKDKPVLMRGYQAREGTLGKNGSDTSFALLAAASLLAFPKEVAARLFKREKVTSVRFDIDEKDRKTFTISGGMKYATLFNQQKRHSQPFVHPDALEISSHFSIPIEVNCWYDSEYRLIVVSNNKHIKYYSKVVERKEGVESKQN